MPAEVCEYPDSGKVGAFGGSGADAHPPHDGDVGAASTTGRANDDGAPDPESLQRIEREVAKYPPEQRQSAVMSALAIAQDEQGWLSNEIMDVVADGPRHAAGGGVRGRDVLQHVQPRARRASTSSRICTNLPCALSGAREAARHLKQKLGVTASTRPPPTAASR